MRISFTITLFVLAILVGGLAVVHTGEKYRHKIFGSTPVQPGEMLFDVAVLDKTQSIRLQNTNDVSLQISKNNNIWETVTPWKDRADKRYIDSLFKFTASLVVQEVIERDGLELKDFGLRQGLIRVTMFDKKGNETCDFRIGRTTAWKIPSEDGKTTQPTIFIRLAEKDKKDKVYICSTESADSVHLLFKDDFSRFRDHRPFYFSPKFLDRIRIQDEAVEIVLTQESAQEPWKIKKPSELRVDRDALGQLFTDVARISAIKVEDRASVTLPTAEEDVAQSREISIHFADQKEDITLKIYPENEEGVALATVSDRPDTVFHLPLTKAVALPGTTALNLMQSGVNDLRSKTMAYISGRDLGTIIIRPGGQQDILLKRNRNSNWKTLRPDGWHLANPNTLMRLITAVTQDKIAKFVTDAATGYAPYGLNRPMLLLGFNSFDGKQRIRLAIGRGPKDNKLYARDLSKPHIWEISPETFGKIALYPWEWRVPHIWHIPKADVIKLSIQRQSKPLIELNYNHFTETWTATEDGTDITSSLNPNRAKFFLDQVTSLKASKWIGPMHPIALSELQKPDTVIKIHMTETTDAGNEESVIKTLKIAHTPGGIIFFGKVDSDPVSKNAEHESSYFYLAPDVITKLYVNLFE